LLFRTEELISFKHLIFIPNAGDCLMRDLLLTALKATTPAVLQTCSRLYRAAWSKDTVLAHATGCVGTFDSKAAQYWWLYLAEDPMTGVYEAGFCGNGAKAPGHFFVKPEAEATGVIATLSFPTELKLLDLTNDTAVLSGICELVQSPDRPACQKMAQEMEDAGFFGVDGFDGLLYSSRMNTGKRMIALHSSVVDKLRLDVELCVQPFNETPEYRLLTSSPFVLPETAF
jgi:hypothetical protein